MMNLVFYLYILETKSHTSKKKTTNYNLLIIMKKANEYIPNGQELIEIYKNLII